MPDNAYHQRPGNLVQTPRFLSIILWCLFGGIVIRDFMLGASAWVMALRGTCGVHVSSENDRKSQHLLDAEPPVW